MLRVPEYYLFDPFTGRLEGFELDVSSREYVPRELDPSGKLASRATGLTLGTVRGQIGNVETSWLRWFDAGGSVLPTARERAEQERERAEQERERAEQERARADDAMRRVAELEARLKGA